MKVCCPNCNHKFPIGKMALALETIPTGEKNAMLYRTISKKVYPEREDHKNKFSTLLNILRSHPDHAREWNFKTKEATIQGKRKGKRPYLIWKEKINAVPRS